MSAIDRTAVPHQATQPQAQPSTDQIVWEQLVAQRAATAQLVAAHDRLMSRLEQLETPAQSFDVVIDAAHNPVELRELVEPATLSIGVYNPNPLIVYFSTVGSAAPNMRSWSAPPNSLVIVPIGAGVVEFGADPALIGGTTIVAKFLRFFTVQPAFLGKGA